MMQFGGVTMNEQSDVSQEMARLKVIAQEIDKAQALPLTEAEQAEQDEAERQQAINSTSMDIADTQYTQAVALGVSSVWTMVFPNWQPLDKDAELMPMAELTRIVIDKHFPNAVEKAGPEVMLGMVCLTAISARMAQGIPPRGKLKNAELQGADDGES